MSKTWKAIALAVSLAMVKPIDAQAKIYNDKEILEETIDEYNQNGELEIGTYTYVSDDPYVITKIHDVVPSCADEYKLKDIVCVQGTGTASSDGIGKTMYFDNKSMVIVGVKSEALFPYALAPINDDGSIGNVVGWFKSENISKIMMIVDMQKHGNIEKNIAHVVQVGIDYDEENDRWVPAIISPFLIHNDNSIVIDDKYAVEVHGVVPDADKYVMFYSNEQEDGFELYEGYEYDVIYKCRFDYNKNVFYVENMPLEHIMDDELVLEKRYGIKSN